MHLQGLTLIIKLGDSLVVHWLGLHASTAGGMGSIPGRGTETHRWYSIIKKNIFTLYQQTEYDFVHIRVMYLCEILVFSVVIWLC